MQVQYCYWPPNNVTKKIKRLEQPDKKNWTRHSQSVCKNRYFILL